MDFPLWFIFMCIAHICIQTVSLKKKIFSELINSFITIFPAIDANRLQKILSNKMIESLNFAAATLNLKKII